MARTKSSALATAMSPVFLPLMISTNAILSTGEKKWMPMNCAAFLLAFAKALIGKVLVLVAKIHSGPITSSTFLVTSAFTFISSNTASTIRSQSLSAA